MSLEREPPPPGGAAARGGGGGGGFDGGLSAGCIAVLLTFILFRG